MLFGCHILITGASSGIGSAVAGYVMDLGAKVTLLARNPERLAAVAADSKQVLSQYFAVDLTDYQAVEHTVNLAVDNFGMISGLVHAAGNAVTLPLKLMNPDQYRELYEINVIAGFNLVRQVIASKKNYSENLSLVFIASVMATLGEVAKIAYTSSKSALLSGSRSMAIELAPRGIRANVVSPGVVQTEMVDRLFRKLPETSINMIRDQHPLGLGKPCDVAALCAFLLSKQAKWITGANIIIDGGYSIK